MIQILFILIGVYALAKAEVQLSSDQVVRGDMARYIGGILLFGAAAPAFHIYGIVVAVVCLVISVVLAVVHREPKSKV